ncbi:phage tail tube protein [Hymenobacter psychrophilus]|uniref:Phage tail tube protein n=1 Tax=Hymenobacter psychrophilus TaxID=651662 RepID=A0A1H3P8Y3_9BACT|nr:hypothetical protein [Hymenobacter psychrophilus]SDY97547.1 hypothetical protein SAMN04488069_1256 [Hymenobacter psychrophilus]
MAIEIVTGLILGLNGIEVGCAQTVSWGASRTEIVAKCAANGGTKVTRPGDKAYTLSVEALARVATGVDAAGNFTYVNLEQLFEDGTIFDFEVGGEEVGSTKKSGQCYVLSYSESSNLDGETTWSADFSVTGDVTYTANA